MLQSYDHSGEETSRKRGIDQQDGNNDDTAAAAANDIEGKGRKIMRQNHNDTEQNEGTTAEKNGDGDDEDDNVVDPPARERPAVSVCVWGRESEMR